MEGNYEWVYEEWAVCKAKEDEDEWTDEEKSQHEGNGD